MVSFSPYYLNLCIYPTLRWWRLPAPNTPLALLIGQNENGLIDDTNLKNPAVYIYGSSHLISLFKRETFDQKHGVFTRLTNNVFTFRIYFQSEEALYHFLISFGSCLQSLPFVVLKTGVIQTFSLRVADLLLLLNEANYKHQLVHPTGLKKDFLSVLANVRQTPIKILLNSLRVNLFLILALLHQRKD